MKTFTRTLKIMIAVNVVIGLILLLWPGAFLDDVHVYGADAGAWARGLGLAIVLLSLAWVPAAVFPLANRFLSLFAAGSQIVLGLYFLFVGPAFRWVLVIYAFVIAWLLITTFWRGFRDDLMARP